MPDPLFLPIALCPPLPVGAPVRFGESVGLWFWIGDGEVDPLAIPANSFRHALWPCDATDIYLDLRAPDPPGSRVDALPIVLGWLGWEIGDALSTSRSADDPGVAGVYLHVAGRCWTHQDVPALVDIDPAHPDALRLACAAVVAGGALITQARVRAAGETP